MGTSNSKKEKRPEKKNRGNKSNKNWKHRKRKRNDKENAKGDEDKKTENPKKIRIKKKGKSINKKSNPMRIELKIGDIMKPNPPPKQTNNISINSNNNNNNNNKKLSSSENGMNVNSYDDNRSDDKSNYELNESQSKSSQSNRSSQYSKSSRNDKGNNSSKNDKSDKSKNELVLKPGEENKTNIEINDIDNNNTEIDENENGEESIESEDEESDFKFGSEEFYQNIMKLPVEKRSQFFIDEELNHLEYKYALEIDKRSFCLLYFSILTRQNTIIFSLSYCRNDFNLGILKFSLFIFQIILFTTISALFFTDNTLNNIYDKKNKFDVPFMIRQLGLTFIICFGVNILFKFLIRTHNKIVDIKEEKENLKDGIKCIRCKLIVYFIITLCILILGWFYISSFCLVYNNTQLILFKCVLYSLAATFVYPFIICLLPTSLIICALSDEKKDRKCIYEFGKVLSYII